MTTGPDTKETPVSSSEDSLAIDDKGDVLAIDAAGDTLAIASPLQPAAGAVITDEKGRPITDEKGQTLITEG